MAPYVRTTDPFLGLPRGRFGAGGASTEPSGLEVAVFAGLPRFFAAVLRLVDGDG